MLNRLTVIRDEVEEELASLAELQRGWQQVKVQGLPSALEKRLAASFLSDFYMAAERIFKLLARVIDRELPQGDDWHKQLLRQMSVEFVEIRPAVIDKRLYRSLEEYLKFRHLVRYIYGFQLDYQRFEYLIDNFAQVAGELERQVLSFLGQMQTLAAD
jgi:hypothetical protein